MFRNFIFCILLAGCASTDIIDSPKTAFVSEAQEKKDPEMIWSSQTLTKNFDYLGQVKVRSWTYDAGLQRLKDAGKEMRADAIVDIHFDRVGFMKTFHAFAIKFKN